MRNRNRPLCRIAAVLLTAAISFTAVCLCGCEGGDGPAKIPGDTIVLAAKKDQRSAAMQQRLEEYIDAYIDAFTKTEPGINVKVNYYTELPKETTGIDCMLLGADDMLLYAAGGLTDAGQYLPFYGIAEDKIAGGAVNASRIADGQPMKMIPVNYDHAVIIADESLFRDAGVDIPGNDWTLTEFEEIAADLTDRRDGEAYSGVYMPYYMNYVWQYFCNLIAGTYLTEGRFDFSKDGSVGQAIERMYSMYTHSAAVSPVLSTISRTCAMSFTFACEPWRNNYSYEAERKININPGKRTDELIASGDLRIIPLPVSDSGKRTGIADTDHIKGFAVPATSSKQNMAGKFAAFSLTEEGQKILVPCFEGIPANRDMWEEEFWRTGVFAGDNAQRALVGVDDGVRDDFTAAIASDNDIYNKNVRMRSVFSAIMVRELSSGRGLDNFMKKLASFALDANKVIDGKTAVYTRE